MVFLSIMNMPKTLNPIGSPFRRLKNTFTCTFVQKKVSEITHTQKNSVRNVIQYFSYITRCWQRHSTNEDIKQLRNKRKRLYIVSKNKRECPVFLITGYRIQHFERGCFSYYGRICSMLDDHLLNRLMFGIVKI